MPLNTKIPQQIVSSTTQALSVKRGEPAMLVADMNRGTIVLMDGKTYGGIPAAREDTQIRAGSSAITVNDGEWSALTGTINIGISPEGFIENVVSPTDKVLAVGDDGKIAAQLSVAYDETSGLFSLKGKDGETISSFTLVIPTGITPKSVALVENPEGQEPGLYLEFVFIDDDDVEIKLYANMDVLKDVYTAGRGITISDDRVISVDEDAISGVIADDLIEEGGGLKVVNDKLHLDDHASDTPEYGLGDEDNYGHVRLADAGDSRATVQAGIAATPAAVKDVDDRAVHKEGDETISGVKTFVDTPQVNLPGGGADTVATLTDVQSVVGNTRWGKYVEGVVPADPSFLIADMPVGAYVTDDKQLPARSVPAPYNTEEWITESGTFTAPVTGWCELWMIGGGNGSQIWGNHRSMSSGYSGRVYQGLIYLTAGQEIPVTIGAGGIGYIGDYASSSNIMGGQTSFGSLTTSGSTVRYAVNTITVPASEVASRYWAISAFGPGGGTADGSIGGHYYGAGAGAKIDNSSPSVADGMQGAIRLRYYDPNKENN